MLQLVYESQLPNCQTVRSYFPELFNNILSVWSTSCKWCMSHHYPIHCLVWYICYNWCMHKHCLRYQIQDSNSKILLSRVCYLHIISLVHKLQFGVWVRTTRYRSQPVRSCYPEVVTNILSVWSICYNYCMSHHYQIQESNSKIMFFRVIYQHIISLVRMLQLVYMSHHYPKQE